MLNNDRLSPGSVYRISNSDKLQLLGIMLVAALAVAVPLVSSGINVSNRLCVVESQVNDLRNEIAGYQKKSVRYAE